MWNGMSPDFKHRSKALEFGHIIEFLTFCLLKRMRASAGAIPQLYCCYLDLGDICVFMSPQMGQVRTHYLSPQPLSEVSA